MTVNPRQTQTSASSSSINLYGVADGTPYDKWPDSALEKLRENVGRNGATTESRDILAEVNAVLTERRNCGVRVTEKQNMHHPI